MPNIVKKKGSMTPAPPVKKLGKRDEKAGEKTEVSSLTLPDAPSEPMTSLAAYLFLLFGEKKIGKTTLVAEIPDTLHLMFEPGGKALSVFQRPVKSWIEFKQYVKLLTETDRFKTVSIDIADIAFKYCEKYVCKKKGIEHPSDEEWGKGYAAVRDEFTEQIQKLVNTGRGVVLISHADEHEIKTRNGETYHKIMPTMPKQARGVIEGLVDMWFYYTYDNGQRVLQVEGDEHVAAGHRLQGRFEHNGVRLKEISMGRSAEEGYKNLVDAFNNKYVPPAVSVKTKPVVAVARPMLKKKPA